MEIQQYKVTNVAACDVMSMSEGQEVRIQKRLAHAGARGILADDALTTSIVLPLLVNTSALAAGTMLKRYTPKTEAKEKEPKAITSALVAKRMKLS